MPRDREGARTLLPQLVFVFVLAVLLIVGLFLAVPYLFGRVEYPQGTYTLVIDGQTVLVEMDPSQEVYLIPLGDNSLEGSGGEGVAMSATPPIIPSVTPNILPSPTPNILPSAVPPTAVPSNDRCITFIDYVVQPGDTLYSISMRYVTSIELMARFGISSVNIVPGSTIRLPIGDATCCPPGWMPYAVQVGQSAFGIATQTGTTVQELQRVNGLDANYSVYAATIICVPQSGRG